MKPLFSCFEKWVVRKCTFFSSRNYYSFFSGKMQFCVFFLTLRKEKFVAHSWTHLSLLPEKKKKLYRRCRLKKERKTFYLYKKEFYLNVHQFCVSFWCAFLRKNWEAAAQKKPKESNLIYHQTSAGHFNYILWKPTILFAHFCCVFPEEKKTGFSVSHILYIIENAQFFEEVLSWYKSSQLLYF